MSLVCCGVVFYGATALLENQVQQAIQANAVVQEHVGEIEGIELTWGESIKADDDVFVYKLEGSKGNATVEVITETIDSDTEELISGRLLLPDGREFMLTPSDEPEAL